MSIGKLHHEVDSVDKETLLLKTQEVLDIFTMATTPPECTVTPRVHVTNKRGNLRFGRGKIKRIFEITEED